MRSSNRSVHSIISRRRRRLIVRTPPLTHSVAHCRYTTPLICLSHSWPYVCVCMHDTPIYHHWKVRNRTPRWVEPWCSSSLVSYLLGKKSPRYYPCLMICIYSACRWNGRFIRQHRPSRRTGETEVVLHSLCSLVTVMIVQRYLCRWRDRLCESVVRDVFVAIRFQETP